MDFAVPVDHKVKIKKIEKIDKYLDLARELKKKTVEDVGEGDTSFSWCYWNGSKGMVKRL